MTYNKAFQAISSLSDPAEGHFDITKSDTVALPKVTRGIYVGGSGNVCCRTVTGDVATYSNVPAGNIIPVRATHVLSTGTTATLMIGMY